MNDFLSFSTTLYNNPNRHCNLHATCWRTRRSSPHLRTACLQEGRILRTNTAYRLQKVLLASANLWPLDTDQRYGMCISNRSYLPYYSEIRLLKVGDTRKLSVFGHLCVRSIGRTLRKSFPSNFEVTCQVLSLQNRQ